MNISALFDELNKSLSNIPRIETGIPAVNDAIDINTVHFMDAVYRAAIEEEVRCLDGHYPIVDSILQARHLAGYDVVEKEVRREFSWKNVLRLDEEDPRIPMDPVSGQLEVAVEDIEENNNPELLDLLRMAIRMNRFAKLERTFREVGVDDDLGSPYVAVEHSQQMPYAFQEFQRSFNPHALNCIQFRDPTLYTTRFWFDTTYALRLIANVTAELPPCKSFNVVAGDNAKQRGLNCYFGVRWATQELLSAFKQRFQKEQYGDTLGDPTSIETIRDAIKEKFPEEKTCSGVAIELDEFSRRVLEKMDNRLRHRLRHLDEPAQYMVLCVNDRDDHLHINGLYSLPEGPLEQVNPVWQQDLTIIEQFEKPMAFVKSDVKRTLVQTPGFFDSDRLYLDVLWAWLEHKLKGGDYVVV